MAQDAKAQALGSTDTPAPNGDTVIILGAPEEVSIGRTYVDQTVYRGNKYHHGVILRVLREATVEEWMRQPRPYRPDAHNVPPNPEYKYFYLAEILD